MKFSAEKATLVKALSAVTSIIERRNTIPILGNILMEADGTSLTIVGTDLDIEMRLSTEINVEAGGGTTVPAGLLNEIAKKAGDTHIRFEFDSAKSSLMKVSSGRSKFELQCLPTSDFPTLAAGTYSHHFTMKTSEMKMLLHKTMFAVSTEETRYYLNGVFFHITDDNGVDVLRAVATDGHRLALSAIPAPDGAAGMPGVIIPRKTVNQLKNVLDLGEDVDVSVSDTKIRFSVANSVMTSKLIDGTFPDYERVIPRSGNKVAILDSKVVAAASDRVSTVSAGKGNAVKLSFDDNKLRLLVVSADNGSADDEVPIEYDSDPITIGFNNRYLQDVFDHIDSRKARITLDDAGSPALIKDEEGGRSLFVLMPMRV